MMNAVDIGTVASALFLLWLIWFVTKMMFKILFFLVLAGLLWGYFQYGQAWFA